MTKLYALPIADTIESYSFNGVEDLHSHYPGWMEGPVVDNFIETVRFNEGFMREHIEPKVNDVFLCNKRGNVKIISDVDLLLHYVSVDGAYGSSGSENLVGLMTDAYAGLRAKLGEPLSRTERFARRAGRAQVQMGAV